MANYEYVDYQKNKSGNTNPVVKMCRWWGCRPRGSTTG